MKFNYKLDFSLKNQKYLLVNLEIELDSKYNDIELIMPTWSPGSYLIREYSRYLDLFEIENNTKFDKINKNTWKIYTKGIDKLNISYRLYCNEFSVRNNFIDDENALITPSSTFLIPKNKNLCKKYQVKIDLPEDWKNISTGLKKIDDNLFFSDNTDDFLDCPIEVGNYNIYSFNSFGKNHNIAIIGPKIYNENNIVKDIKNIVDTVGKIMGNNVPYDEYTFILYLTSGSKGGLEHKNSSVLHFPRWDINNIYEYRTSFLSLVSHEYFHLWNIKRIKPLELLDFDYSNENYTSLLWVAEGFTSYIDDLVLKRANIYTDEEYLKILSQLFERQVKVPGRFYENMEDSSFYSWIKFYRKHENINNQSISYYVKGAHLAWALDMEILNSTNGEKSFEDLILVLWDNYLKDNKFGYTREIIEKYSSEIANKDLSDFFKEFLEDTNEIDYYKYLSFVGLKLDISYNDNPSINCDLSNENDKVFIKTVIDRGAGYYAGLNNGDEIISINDYRVTSKNINSIISSFKVGDKINILVSRDEKLKKIELCLFNSGVERLTIYDIENKSKKQKKLYKKWLKTIY